MTKQHILRVASLLFISLLVFSCKEKDNPGGGGSDKPAGEITTLAGLLEHSTSTSAAFDFTISNLVVTAVYENYAQLEDGTSGAQLNKAGHGLKAVQR